MERMCEKHRGLVDGLVRQYQRLHKEPPSWACRLSPSIPFVGRNWLRASPRIAIYASAENLAHYERRPDTKPDFLRDERVWNRHRAQRAASPPRFFPLVHIAPVEKGGLMCAALFLWQRLSTASLPVKPADLLEEMVVANVAKFSIKTGGAPNKDYASNNRRLEASVPFFAADLRAMRPDVVVMPKKVLRTECVRRVVDAANVGLVLPVPQCNATVINCHLAKHAARAGAMESSMRGTTLATWTQHVTGVRPSHVYRYLVELEDLLESGPEAN